MAGGMWCKARLHCDRPTSPDSKVSERTKCHTVLRCLAFGERYVWAWKKHFMLINGQFFFSLHKQYFFLVLQLIRVVKEVRANCQRQGLFNSEKVAAQHKKPSLLDCSILYIRTREGSQVEVPHQSHSGCSHPWWSIIPTMWTFTSSV